MIVVAIAGVVFTQKRDLIWRLLGVICVLGAFTFFLVLYFMPSRRRVPPASPLGAMKNNVQQIVLALINYSDQRTTASFPRRCFTARTANRSIAGVS